MQVTLDKIPKISQIKKDISEIRIIDTANKKYSESFINAMMQSKDLSYEAALQSVFKLIKPNDIFTVDDAELAIKSTFFDVSRYDLLNVGRYKLNQSLGLDIDPSVRTLTKEDI